MSSYSQSLRPRTPWTGLISRSQAIVVKEKAEKADIFAEEIGREKTRVNTEVGVGWGRWQGPSGTPAEWGVGEVRSEII